MQLSEANNAICRSFVLESKKVGTVKKLLVITKLILLLLVAVGLLLFVAALIAVLLVWLIYMPLPAVAKAGLLVLVIVASPLVFARWQRHRREKARTRRTVVEALDDSDDMMVALDLPKLTQEQRDVLRATLDVLLEHWSRRARKSNAESSRNAEGET
jgi:hypothetical protein